MKKLIIIFLICGCSAGKITTSPIVSKPYKYVRIVTVDRDGSAKAMEIHKIK